MLMVYAAAVLSVCLIDSTELPLSPCHGPMDSTELSTSDVFLHVALYNMGLINVHAILHSRPEMASYNIRAKDIKRYCTPLQRVHFNKRLGRRHF